MSTVDVNRVIVAGEIQLFGSVLLTVTFHNECQLLAYPVFCGGS
jgi:hypothetical protein